MLSMVVIPIYTQTIFGLVWCGGVVVIGLMAR